jgi:hypothetical protein
MDFLLDAFSDIQVIGSQDLPRPGGVPVRIGPLMRVSVQLATPGEHRAPHLPGLARSKPRKNRSEARWNSHRSGKSGWIYRAKSDLTVDEDSAIDPQSPYAHTKAVCEAIFADIAASQPLRVLSLRYFNPVGADPKMRTGLQLRQPTNVLGKMIQAREQGVPFLITGTDWPTRDGTGIRDHVHVWDLAAAHVAALARFDLPTQST